MKTLEKRIKAIKVRPALTRKDQPMTDIQPVDTAEDLAVLPPMEPGVDFPDGAITLATLDHGMLDREFRRCLRLVTENIEHEDFQRTEKRTITLTITVRGQDEGPDLEITHTSGIKLAQPRNGQVRTSRAVVREWNRDDERQTVLFPVE